MCYSYNSSPSLHDDRQYKCIITSAVLLKAVETYLKVDGQSRLVESVINLSPSRRFEINSSKCAVLNIFMIQEVKLTPTKSIQLISTILNLSMLTEGTENVEKKLSHA